MAKKKKDQKTKIKFTVALNECLNSLVVRLH